LNLPFEYKSDLGRSSAFGKLAKISDRLSSGRLYTIGCIGTVESCAHQPDDSIGITGDRNSGERNLNGLILIMPNLLTETTIMVLGNIRRVWSDPNSIGTAIYLDLYLS
jgi:hypothetical protein